MSKRAYNKWHVNIGKPIMQDSVIIAIQRYLPNGNLEYMTVENGKTKIVGKDKFDDMHDKVPYFVELSGLEYGEVLQEFSDSIAEFGYFPEVLNREKIVQGALAEERLRQIGYLTGIVDKIVDKALK